MAFDIAQLLYNQANYNNVSSIWQLIILLLSDAFNRLDSNVTQIHSAVFFFLSKFIATFKMIAFSYAIDDISDN